MTIRRGALIILWLSTLAACVGDAASRGDDAPDGAVVDYGAGGAGALQVGSPPSARTVDTASPRAARALRAAGQLAHASLVAAAANASAAESESSSVPTAALQQPTIADDASAETAAATVTPVIAETDEPERAPITGVTLALPIAGPRALIATLEGETPEHGPLRVLEDQGSVLGLARVRAAALDPASRAWLRRPVRVFTSANQSCTGHVASFDLATPWVWKGELAVSEELPSRAEVEAGLLPMLGSVVARVVLDGPEPCSGVPLLIQDAAQPSLRVARTLPHVPRQRQVLEAFRRLPRYRAMRAECEQHGECLEDEESGVPAGRPIELTAFQFPNDANMYVVASMAEGSCGDWGPPLSAIFVLGRSRRGAPTLYRVNEDGELGTPRLMIDMGRDGRLGFVTARVFGDVELVEEQGASRQLWSTYFVGCHC